uniref:SAM domain-containing protein n=1 Tax=Parascaris univalens TaxID=6257 RepID=A0A915CAA6_PARUN
MADMDPSIPSNNSSMYSGVSSVMPPSTDSSSRTTLHLPSNPPASTVIVAVAPPAATAHHFISSVASSLSKVNLQSNMPVGVSVAQFVDSFRTRGQTSQHSVHPTYITPATHLDAPQMIQANILHLSTVRLPQPELCCGTLPASMFPYTAEKPQPERGDGFELTSMGNSSLTNTDSEVTVTVHGMKPVMSVSPTPSGTSLLPNNRSSGSQGCTTEAVAAAMLSNVPLRWPSHPQSSTAESSNGCFGIAQQRAFGSRFPLPRFNQRQSPVLSTATNRGNANHSRRMMNTHFNNECRFAAKRILPLKPNFSGERLTADGSKSIQGNPSIDVHKEDVGLPSNVRLSPGGGLPQARVGDFHTSSLKSISQSQGIRDGRFSSHDYRNDSRDNRAGASRECRSDLHAQTRDFRGYKNEMHEFSIESHGSRNESHGSRVLRKISRDLRGEGRDCMNGLKDWAREPCGLRDELKGTSFGRQSPRGVMPLSYAVANGRDISAWSRSFHHDFPPPSVDSSAFRRDGFQKTPTFLFSRGFRRGMKDGSSRGDANRFCQPRNVTLSSTVHFGACASTRVDDASSMECALAAGHGVNPRLFDVRGSFSSAPASCRNNRDVLQMQEEHIPNRAEVNNRRERSDVENATSPEEKEPSTLPERLVENESEQGRDDSTQAFITTSSLTVGATAMKTYADIAKCVDAVKVVDAVCCHENNQAMKSKESTSDAARSANCIEKSVENTKHLKSYAEMTKKSVEKYSDATSSAARLLDPSESPNSRSSGSEIGSIKEKIEWTLANFDDVHKVLSRIGCQHLVPLFNARNIQMRDFCALSEDDLMRLGIKSSSERSRIHRAILRLRFAQHK